MGAAGADVALEYVRLGLRFDRLESGFVDAYTGDPRVRAAVEELGYRLNATARTLSLGRATAELATMALRSGDLLGSDGVKTGHDPDEHPTGGTGPELTGARPFGLRFATLPDRAVDLPLDTIAYDDDTQVALARDGAGWAPLADHSMGLTLRTTGQIPREDEIHDKSS